VVLIRETAEGEPSMLKIRSSQNCDRAIRELGAYYILDLETGRAVATHLETAREAEEMLRDLQEEEWSAA
jgi:hypothetical protein